MIIIFFHISAVWMSFLLCLNTWLGRFFFSYQKCFPSGCCYSSHSCTTYHIKRAKINQKMANQASQKLDVLAFLWDSSLMMAGSHTNHPPQLLKPKWPTFSSAWWMCARGSVFCTHRRVNVYRHLNRFTRVCCWRRRARCSVRFWALILMISSNPLWASVSPLWPASG